MKNKFILIPLLILLISGCSPIVDENTKKLILEKDPAFKETLDKKIILDAQITDLRAKLIEKTENTNAKINALRDELRFTQNEVNKQITALKSELDPDRGKISSEISLLRDELNSKSQSLKSLRSAKKNVEKLIKKNQSSGQTSPDIKMWSKEVNDINDKIAPLEEDIKILNSKIKFLKLKLATLRQ